MFKLATKRVDCWLMLEFIAGLIGGDISAGLWQRKKRSNGAHYAMAAAGALLLIALIATSLLLD